MQDFDLHSYFKYDPVKGKIYWRIGNRRGSAGSEAGYWLRGRRRITIKGKKIPTARLAWFLTHSEWPVGEIDHINRDKGDDRLCNLRDVSHSENMCNQNFEARVSKWKDTRYNRRSYNAND
jgi:hypothetical protein